MYFKDLLRYRNAWIGLGVLWVVMFHFGADFHVGILNFLRNNGYGGVDICFFASGIGCFFSLSSDADVGNFMKRRLKRLLPTYLVFIVFWLIFKYALGEFDLQMALGNILAVQNFTGLGNYLNWYISALFLFYLLAPYFKIVIDRASPVCSALFLLLLILFSVPFWGATTYIITVTRFAIFYIGMLFAKMCRRETKIRPVHLVFAAAAFAAGTAALMISYAYFPQLLWSCGLHWYPFILITVPLCIAISYVMRFLEKYKVTRPIAGFASLCGKYSFEIYLLQFPLVTIVGKLIVRYGLMEHRDYIWLLGMPVLAIACYALRRLTKLSEYVYGKAKQRLQKT